MVSQQMWTSPAYNLNIAEGRDFSKPHSMLTNSQDQLLICGVFMVSVQNGVDVS